MRDTDTYVLYRGDEVIDIGTAKEIADRRGVKADTILPYATPSLVVTDELGETERGDNGFGHGGR